MTRRKMPLRLSELTKGYPYSKQISSEDDILPHPRLSTRSYDALYVRLDTQLPDHNIPKPKQHPLRIIADAFRSELSASNEEYDKLWDTIKNTATSSLETELAPAEAESFPILSQVFGDETIRLLSLIPADNSNNTTVVTLSPRMVRPGRIGRRRSHSLGHPNGKTTKSNGTTHDVASPTSLNSPTENISAISPTSPKDWTDFSTTGFGDSNLGSNFAATLFDNDIEVTSPPSRKPSRRQFASSDYGRRSSVDNPNPTSPNSRSPKQWKTKALVSGLTKIDEAFIDFWSDGLVDPIASDWPNFVVCQLKSIPEVGQVGWLVIEQTFSRPPPPPEPVAPLPANARRASSPRPSLHSEASGRRSSTFVNARKRFSFFSAGSKESVVTAHEGKAAMRKKAAKAPKVGEMGEILAEVEEKPLKQETVPPVPVKEPSAPSAPTALGLIGVEDGTSSAPVVADDALKVQVEDASSGKPANVPPVQAVSTAQNNAEPSSPAVEATSPISLTDTPTAADFPPVPVNGTRPVPPASAATATMPIRTDDTVGKPKVSVPEVVAIPADITEAASADVLPPAPESVVIAGETPGPHVALETSEPVVLAESSTETKVEIAEMPAVAKVVEEPSHAAENSVVAATENVAQEQVDDAPAQSAPEKQLPDTPQSDELAVAPPVPAAKDEPTPQEPSVSQSHDVIIEATGSVIEQASTLPLDSDETLNEVVTIRPPISAIVPSPMEAVRTISSSAEVLDAAAEPPIEESTAEAVAEDPRVEEPAAEVVVEESPVDNAHAVEASEVQPSVEAPEPVVKNVHETEEQAPELENPSAVATELPVEEPVEHVESEPVSTEAIVAPVEEVASDTAAPEEETPAPLNEEQTERTDVHVEEHAEPVPEAQPAAAQEEEVAVPQEVSVPIQEELSHIEGEQIADAPEVQTVHEPSQTAPIEEETAAPVVTSDPIHEDKTEDVPVDVPTTTAVTETPANGSHHPEEDKIPEAHQEQPTSEPAGEGERLVLHSFVECTDNVCTAAA